MLASATLVPEEEYLRTTYKPASDYIDGVLRQKSIPTLRHSEAQFTISMLVRRVPGFTAHPELTCWVREGKYLVPDVAVRRVDELQDPYPVRPIHLCVEILSPEYRFSDAVSKCGEYHAWGVPCCWIVDPDDRRCWEYANGRRPTPIAADGYISAGPLSVSVAEIFGRL
jgi:Uma2 family endonuclease